LYNPTVFEQGSQNSPSTNIRLCEIQLRDGRGRNTISTDLELFAQMRQRSNAVRNSHWRRLLYRPYDIHFVRFGVLRAGYHTGIYNKLWPYRPNSKSSRRGTTNTNFYSTLCYQWTAGHSSITFTITMTTRLLVAVRRSTACSEAGHQHICPTRSQPAARLGSPHNRRA
jgi:hypothetical protein